MQFQELTNQKNLQETKYSKWVNYFGSDKKFQCKKQGFFTKARKPNLDLLLEN